MFLPRSVRCMKEPYSKSKDLCSVPKTLYFLRLQFNNLLMKKVIPTTSGYNILFLARI